MLMQPRTTVTFDFPQLSHLQSSPIKRKNIIIQPPLDMPTSTTRPFLNMTSFPTSLLNFKEKPEFMTVHHKLEPMLTDLSLTRESESEKSEFSPLSPKVSRYPVKNKVISKMKPAKSNKEKKTYEISRFFVKNYVGALKSTLNNPQSENDILLFLGCSKEHIPVIKQELDKLLKENPKHNRMQLYKLIINPVLNPVFQYFLRRKVVSWIFTSSKMQDRPAHLMARKNFLHLCLKAKELTPYNFKIALNFK